jgi:hypothetical protein
VMANMDATITLKIRGVSYPATSSPGVLQGRDVAASVAIPKFASSCGTL